MVRMNWKEVFFVSGNACILAIFYTLLGSLVSYVMYHIFDTHDDKWEKRPLWFQLTDVSLETALLSIVAFWSAQIIEIAPPVFPVRKELDVLVDSYISGIFFIFAIFLFLDELTTKYKYLFERIFKPFFNKIFPQYGSIIDFSLSYTPRKTDEEKDRAM
jgi:hypothetical protein